MATTRKLEYLPLDGIVGADVNPKRHALGSLGKSVARFGYIEPVVLDERTGKLVAGHGRVEYLRSQQAEGGEPPDGVRTVKGQWQVPVLRGWASKDDAEADAYLLASNRITELGGWDDEELAGLLDGLEESVRDATGFDQAYVDVLLADLAARDMDASDFEEHWNGMPGFDNPKGGGKYAVKVHFATAERVNEFFAKLGCAPPARMKGGTQAASMWFPPEDAPEPVGSVVGTEVIAE